jgi:hypothetical protein
MASMGIYFFVDIFGNVEGILFYDGVFACWACWYFLGYF